MIGINVGETGPLDDPTRFVRLRDELFYKVRQWFHARDCKIPNDPVLISELSAPSYKLTSSGKILVERKDEMKARGLKSPNAADALAMTFQVGDYSARHHRQTHGIDDGYRSLDAYADTRPMARSSGWFSGAGDAPTWNEGQQTHAIN